MLNNIILFTGEEKYLLANELLRWRTNFSEKYGNESVFVFDSHNWDLGSIRQAIYGGGLFVTKKLVVLYGMPLDSDPMNKISSSVVDSFVEEFLQLHGTIPQDTFLVFISYKPDKRGKLYKFLEKEATVKAFEPLSFGELKNFVREHTSLVLDNDVLEYFLAKVGTDLYHVLHECEKLHVWCTIHNIQIVTKEVVDTVNFGLVESNGFDFFDTYFVNQKKCLSVIGKVQDEGVNWIMFAGTLYWGIKLWIFALDLWNQGVRDSKHIASTLKAHPFVVSKMVKHIDVLLAHQNQIHTLYTGLVEVDAKIKSGKVPEQYFWLWIKKMVIQK